MSRTTQWSAGFGSEVIFWPTPLDQTGHRIDLGGHVGPDQGGYPADVPYLAGSLAKDRRSVRAAAP